MGKPNQPMVQNMFRGVIGIPGIPHFQRHPNIILIVDHISHHIPTKLYIPYVYPDVFSISYVSKSLGSSWFKVPFKMAFRRHRRVTVSRYESRPSRLWRATLLQVLLGGLDDVGAESGSAAIVISRGISPDGFFLWM